MSERSFHDVALDAKYNRRKPYSVSQNEAVFGKDFD